MLHRLRAAVTCLCLLAAAPAHAEVRQSALREIKVTGGGAAPVVEIIADAPLTFTSYTMPQLLHAVIDLPNASPGQVRTSIPVHSGMIDKISVVQKSVNDLPLTRVVIHTQREVNLSVAPDPANPGRLIASLSPAPPTPTPPPASAVPPPQVPPAAVEPAPAVSAAPREAKIAPAAGTVPLATQPGTAPSREAQQPTVRRIAVVADGIEVVAGAPLAGYRVFTLKEPNRLVIDIPAAGALAATFTLPANPWGITGARAGLYPDKLRLVFDSGSRPLPPCEVQTTASGLKITFPAPGKTPTAATKPRP